MEESGNSGYDEYIKRKGLQIMALAKYYEDNEEIMLERIRNREHNLKEYHTVKIKQAQGFGISEAKPEEVE